MQNLPLSSIVSTCIVTQRTPTQTRRSNEESKHESNFLNSESLSFSSHIFLHFVSKRLSGNILCNQHLLSSPFNFCTVKSTGDSSAISTGQSWDMDILTEIEKAEFQEAFQHFDKVRLLNETFFVSL